MSVADKAEVFAKTLTAREAQAASLREAIELARAVEEMSLRDDINARPTSRPYGDPTSTTSKAKRKLAKLQRELAGVEAELPILRRAALDAGREQVERELLEKEAELRAIEGRAPRIWAELGDQFQTLVAMYVVGLGELTRDRVRISREAREACDSYGDLRDRWENTIYPAQQVRELPASFASALSRLESEAMDDRELANVLRDRPEAWVSTGMGAAVSGVTAAFGPGVVVRREET